MTQTPAGWYPNPDPNGTGERYWDGAQWGQTREAIPAYAPPPPPQASGPGYLAPMPTKTEKPIWQRWWVIAIAVVIVLSVIGAATGSGSDSDDDKASSTATSTTSAEPSAPASSKAPEPVVEEEPEPEPEPELTGAQENAIESAQSYLDLTGFSRKGLIQQLTSDAGAGFKRKDAEFAVDYLKPDWKAEAVESAESYLELTSFSRSGLIEQLTSDAGAGFTKAEAEYAAKKVYDK